MKKLLIIIFLLLPLTVQASEDFIKVAGKAGLFYASVFGLRYALSAYVPTGIEHELQRNHDKYAVTDELLTNLIQQEAQKKGLDFSKFIVVKNMDPEMTTISLLGAAKSVVSVGSEKFLTEFSAMDEAVQKAIVQHELNHIYYNHSAKTFGVRALSNYIGFLAGYAGVSLATNYVANYIDASCMRTVWPFMSVGLCLYAGRYLDKKCSRIYRKYSEKQADLATDDDPVVIRGAITFLQADHDRAVGKFGQQFVEQHPEQVFGEDHPAPLERIAYLEKKFERCSSNDESGSF